MLFFGDENDRNSPLGERDLQPHRQDCQQKVKASEGLHFSDVELKKLSLYSVDPKTMEVLGIGSIFNPKLWRRLDRWGSRAGGSGKP